MNGVWHSIRAKSVSQAIVKQHCLGKDAGILWLGFNPSTQFRMLICR
jgi:hypothetical protein